MAVHRPPSLEYRPTLKHLTVTSGSGDLWESLQFGKTLVKPLGGGWHGWSKEGCGCSYRGPGEKS